MKNIKKIVLASCFVLSIFILVFAFNSVKVEAAGISSNGTGGGDWNNVLTWSGGVVPTDQNVTIVSGDVVNVTDDATAGAISIENAGATTGINISADKNLTVSGGISLSAPGGDGTSTLAVGAGNLSALNMSITGGGGLKISEVTISTGRMELSSDLFFAGDLPTAKLTSTDLSDIYIGGNFGFTGMGTFDGAGSTLYLDGSIAQAIAASEFYNNVYVANTSGGVTLSTVGNTYINGTLQIFSATDPAVLDTALSNLTVDLGTSIGDGATLKISNTAGSKTFTGDVDILAGGTWEETAAENITFGAHFVNDGTVTASTGGHTFNGTALIGGTNPIEFSKLAVGAAQVLTNTGTLTVSGLLSGAGTLLNGNGATGTLTIGDPGPMAVLDATTVFNSVSYNRAGDQTVEPTDYYDLMLEGTGIKTIGAATSILGDLNIDPAVTVDLTGDSDATAFYIDGVLQEGGVWGEVGSTNPLVDHESALLTGDGSIAVPDITPPTVTVTMDDYALTVGETATITFTFSEVPVGFGDTDVTVQSGTIPSVVATGDPLVFTATFTPTAGISDTTNIVTVGIAWSDAALNPPIGTTDSANYIVNTVAAAATNRGSSGGSIHNVSPLLSPTSPTDCQSGYLFSPSTGKACGTSSPTAPITPSEFTFTKTLKYLMIDSEVKELQKFLNTHNYQLATIGAGSLGYETTKFGPLTKSALIKFQSAKNLDPDGIVGPMTRGVLNSL